VILMKMFAPKLDAAISIDEDLVRPSFYCHRTWFDGLSALTQDLMEVSRRWTELGLEDTCPYPLLTPDKLAIHRKHQDRFFIKVELLEKLHQSLSIRRDGWVCFDLWEATKAAQKTHFDHLLLIMEEALPQFSVVCLSYKPLQALRAFRVYDTTSEGKIKVLPLKNRSQIYTCAYIAIFAKVVPRRLVIYPFTIYNI